MGLGVGLAVDVGVGVGRGVGVGVGVGVGEGGADDVADGDGFALVGEAEGAAAGGALVTTAAPVAGDRVGDAGPAEPEPAVTEAVAEPGELPGRPASADRGGCEPLSASTVIIPVATIATRTPMAAATPDSASSRRFGGLTGSGKPLGRNGPARSITFRRYDSESGWTSAHSPSTSSRNSGGGVASGAMPYSVAGRSAPCLRSVQTSHWSMCALIALARQRGQPAVPVVEQHVEFRAGPAPGARYEQGAERLFQLAAGARGHGVGLVPRHAEHRGEVGAMQVVPEVEFDDLAFIRVQPVEGGPDELA